MSISAVGSAASMRSAPMPERLEGPGPDNDHDADDRPAAAPAPGTGQMVDKSA